MVSRKIVLTISLTSLVAACAGVTPPVLSSRGPGPGAGSYRFFSDAPGEKPGDSGVRPRVESLLAAKGFTKAEGDTRYLVEVSVTARPLNVGASSPAGALSAPAAKRPGAGDKGVCAVRVRFVDAKSLAEAYSVSAQRQARVKDCMTEDASLVAMALKDIPLKN